MSDIHDQAAWEEFVTLYRPMIEQVCRRLKLAESDVHDATQEVLMHLVQVVEQWRADVSGATFRGWLYRVSRNLLLRWKKHQCLPDLGSGKTAVHEILGQQQDPSLAESVEYDMQFRRQVFLKAAENIRPRFQAHNWQAFWETVVLGKSVSTVADKLNIRQGSLYVSRCRIMAQLRDEAQRLLGQHELAWDTTDSGQPNLAARSRHDVEEQINETR